jgi:hypothetical protein
MGNVLGDVPGITNRARAILRAVAAGRAEVSCSCEPDLRVDGLMCCDQASVRTLVHRGYIRLSAARTLGKWEPAQLTAAGLALLAA